MALPRLLRRGPAFTAHNVRLANGRETLPGQPLIGAEPVSLSHLRSFQLLCPPPARVADLGCLEGGLSVELARAGYEVLGVEGQPENFAKCEWVAQRVKLPNLSFVQDDVRNLAAHGTFDGVLCSGLLYHLDQPVEFLELLGRLTSRLLVLVTQFATAGGAEVAQFAPRLAGELVEHEGRLGRWYEEEAAPWSSVGNPRSFWLERRHLFAAIIAAGFPAVYEQLDWVGDPVANRVDEEMTRSVFVAVKPDQPV